MILNLAFNYKKGLKASRLLSQEEDVSYQLSCKLLQKLSSAGFVESNMGVKGGFELSKPPSQISIYDIIVAIQGPITLNKCVLGKDACPRQGTCPMTAKLNGLQATMVGALQDTTIADLVEMER